MAKSASSAIKLSTLSELLQSTSPEIRDATIKIVAERALQSPVVWALLRRQLRSKTDLKVRDQALCILVQFGPGSNYDVRMRRDESRSIEFGEFFHPATFKACIACLCNMLPAARQAEYLRQHHESAEADALWFVHKLLENDIGLALEAGLVRKWLANYPLNVRTPEKSKKEIIREMIRAYEYADDYERLLCCVIHDMTEKLEARAAMQECSIGDPGAIYDMLKSQNRWTWGARHHYAPSPSERRFGGGGDYGRNASEARHTALFPLDMFSMGLPHTGDFRLAPGEEPFAQVARDHDGEPESEVLDEHAPLLGRDERVVRRREESDEERARRSRRREAMVFAEGGGPIRREDIIESRREEIMDEEVEEELEQLIEEVGEGLDRSVDEGTGEGQRTWLDFLLALRPDGSVRR